MAKSVRDLPDEIHALIEVREWDMHTAESREQFQATKVKRIPSIAIDGKLVFEALIPDRDALVEEIMRYFNRGRKGNDGK